MPSCFQSACPSLFESLPDAASDVDGSMVCLTRLPYSRHALSSFLAGSVECPRRLMRPPHSSPRTAFVEKFMYHHEFLTLTWDCKKNVDEARDQDSTAGIDTSRIMFDTKEMVDQAAREQAKAWNGSEDSWLMKIFDKLETGIDRGHRVPDALGGNLSVKNTIPQVAWNNRFSGLHKVAEDALVNACKFDGTKYKHELKKCFTVKEKSGDVVHFPYSWELSAEATNDMNDPEGKKLWDEKGKWCTSERGLTASGNSCSSGEIKGNEDLYNLFGTVARELGWELSDLISCKGV